MKKAALILTIATTAAIAAADGLVQQLNDLGYGTFSGRLQTLSMYRDYDAGENNHSTTLGLQVDYLSPENEGWLIGASYTGAGVLDSMDDGAVNPGDSLVLNGRVNNLNEGYLQYDLTGTGISNTTAVIGRRVNNGEVFRSDDFRQKKRSIEAVMIETRAFHSTRLQVGHAWKESNMWDTDSHPTLSSWKFQDFGEVFNTGYDTDGVTWGELVNDCIENLEIAVFDALAYDVVNLIGARARWTLSENSALLAYARNEKDIGENTDHTASAFGLALEQDIGDIKLEGGVFSVSGDGLYFQELTTGINHALGNSLMLYSGQFSAGADTVYLKAATKLEETKTTLYCLYNYTLHDENKSAWRQAQELNVVIKQPVPKLDNLTVAFKGGIGTRDGIDGASDTTGSDARLFVTYTF